MPQGAACPDRAILEEYAVNERGDHALKAHLATCPACQALLERLKAENLWFLLEGRVAVATDGP